MKLIFQMVEYWRQELESFACWKFWLVVWHGKILVDEIGPS